MNWCGATSVILSMTLPISQGDMNWPFLTLTGLPAFATFCMKLVCRHRKAGVWITSTTAATSPSGVSSCTSVSTGTPTCCFTFLRILEKVKQQVGVPVLTDVHEDTPLGEVAAVVDVIQTPAFLCRQTNFMQNVAKAGK